MGDASECGRLTKFGSRNFGTDTSISQYDLGTDGFNSDRFRARISVAGNRIADVLQL